MYHIVVGNDAERAIKHPDADSNRQAFTTGTGTHIITISSVHSHSGTNK